MSLSNKKKYLPLYSNNKTMKTNDIINELVIIGNWAKSCKTKEQLEVVDKFLDKKIRLYPKKHIGIEVSFNIGMVSGIILSLKKLKFGNS